MKQVHKRQKLLASKTPVLQLGGRVWQQTFSIQDVQDVGRAVSAP